MNCFPDNIYGFAYFAKDGKSLCVVGDYFPYLSRFHGDSGEKML